jgi:guanylate kinase
MGLFGGKSNKGRVDPNRVGKGTSAGGQFAPDQRGSSNIPMALAASRPVSPIKKGNLVILGGPGGVGKDTIMRELLKKNESMKIAVSHTTRPPRVGEIEGDAYHFISEEEFDKIIESGDFLEHVTFGKSRYGLLKSKVVESLENGTDIVTIMDLNGAGQAKESYPDSKVIFLVPPSIETLREHMSGRGDGEAAIQARIDIAENEIKMGHLLADKVVVSDNVERTTNEISSLL